MPSRGLMGWRSIATILTPFRGFGSDFSSSFVVSELRISESVGSTPYTASSCCRIFSCLSSHAVRPNFSPLIRTRDRT